MATINVQLLHLLRETLWGDGKKYFQSLNEKQKQQLCPEMMTAHLCCWCYRALYDVLPETFRKPFHTSYLYRSGKVAQQQQMKNELFALLETNRIRFAPIKGADLAFELYPDPVLRYFCDLDILIHPEDCLRALEVLDQAHWQELSDKTQFPEHHHYTIRSKNHVALEPHKTLPQFDHVSAETIWQHIHPVHPGNFQHRLEPELQLLLLVRHAANHCEESVYKLLLDAAHILKNGSVSMEKLQQLVQKWEMPYPGHFLAAFPEFFPEDILKQARGSQEGAKLYRQLFEQSAGCARISQHHRVVSQKFWKKKWWQKRLQGLTPLTLRNKYHLPVRGTYIRLAAVFIYDLFIKTATFFRYLFIRNNSVKNYCNISDKIDRL